MAGFIFDIRNYIHLNFFKVTILKYGNHWFLDTISSKSEKITLPSFHKFNILYLTNDPADTGEVEERKPLNGLVESSGHAP